MSQVYIVCMCLSVLLFYACSVEHFIEQTKKREKNMNCMSHRAKNFSLLLLQRQGLTYSLWSVTVKFFWVLARFTILGLKQGWRFVERCRKCKHLQRFVTTVPVQLTEECQQYVLYCKHCLCFIHCIHWTEFFSLGIFKRFCGFDNLALWFSNVCHVHCLSEKFIWKR